MWQATSRAHTQETTNDPQRVSHLWAGRAGSGLSGRAARLEPGQGGPGAQCSQDGSGQSWLVPIDLRFLSPLHRRQMMGIQMNNLVNALVYAAIGIVIFAGAFMVLDKVTPYNLWKEIVQEHNLALSILLGAMSLG